ncbi:hypothetical protein D3C81_948480 [compost metagenome]
MDESLDNLADLEKFEPFPAGSHQVSLGFLTEENNGLPVVKMNMTMVESLELANSTDVPPEPGKKVGMSYFLKYKDKQTQEIVPNKVGQGQLKEILAVLAATFGGASPREIMANSEGANVAVTLKVRASKDDPDVKFNTLKAIAIV